MAMSATRRMKRAWRSMSLLAVVIVHKSTVSSSFQGATTRSRNCWLGQPTEDNVRSLPAVRRRPYLLQQPWRCRLARRRDDDQGDDNRNGGANDELSVFRMVDGVRDLASRPFLPSMSVGYPLALLLVFAAVPVTQALLTIAFFAVYVVLGRQFMLNGDGDGEPDDDRDAEKEEDDEASKINLFALPGAILSASLLGNPFSNSVASTVASPVASPLSVAVVLAGVLVVALVSVRSSGDQSKSSSATPTSPPDQRLMDLWDEEFRRRHEEEMDD